MMRSVGKAHLSATRLPAKQFWATTPSKAGEVDSSIAHGEFIENPIMRPIVLFHARPLSVNLILGWPRKLALARSTAGHTRVTKGTTLYDTTM